MVTLAQALQWGEDVLKSGNIEFPRTDGEWILANLLPCRRVELAWRQGEELSPEKWEVFKNSIERRRSRVPLQHLLGTVPFGDLCLLVDPRALIPRPETEQLVEIIGQRMRAHPPRTILDMGTGSGACILALGSLFPAAVLTACDNSIDALELAARNARRCQLDHRIRLVYSHWFTRLRGQWDLIVANPPYLAEGEWEMAAAEVRDFEPKEALVSGDGGCADLKKILGHAAKFLTADGLLALEMGIHHGAKLRAWAGIHGLSPVEIAADFNGHDRFLFAKREGMALKPCHGRQHVGALPIHHPGAQSESPEFWNSFRCPPLRPGP
jgi:release factor glutamine methyltransferase